MSKDYAKASWYGVNDLQEKLHNLAMLREELPESVPHLDEDIEQLYGQLMMMTNCAEETITKARNAVHMANVALQRQL
jgi:uncharacterized protein YpbB